MQTPPSRWTCPAWWLALAVPLLVAWDLSGADLALARLAGGPAGFALTDHWLLTTVLHQGGRIAGWALALSLVLAVWWPVGHLRRLAWNRRLQLAATPMAITAVIGVLKATSGTDCPWHLAGFGGVAAYRSHWLDLFHGSGGGHCFPAGHAAAGFAFVGGFWAWRDTAPRLARRWLIAALATGLVLGLGQQLRGAHFMSHTLWSGWIACAVAMALDALWRRFEARTPPPPGAGFARPRASSARTGLPARFDRAMSTAQARPRTAPGRPERLSAAAPSTKVAP
jgi:membrane-associated PAP2 superfamily phosphatase